jgi:AcrR family transcriptional regulator
MATTAKRPRRRTQAERREATRAALLDATIASIVEEGYANTTTRGIAERAGVTSGAQAHHFQTKAELVAAALRQLTEQLADQMLAEAAPSGRSRARQVERLLDQLWEVHRGPAFQASLELWVAARTDPEVRAALVDVERDVGMRVADGIAQLFPEQAGSRQFVEIVTTGLATMRGLAMLQFVGRKQVDDAWPATRRHLLAMFAVLVPR